MIAAAAAGVDESELAGVGGAVVATGPAGNPSPPSLRVMTVSLKDSEN